jgi:hypothetical protein
VASRSHVPPVVNVHTHPRPASVLSIVEPSGIELATRDGAWYFRSGDVSPHAEVYGRGDLDTVVHSDHKKVRGRNAAERLSRATGA